MKQFPSPIRVDWLLNELRESLLDLSSVRTVPDTFEVIYRNTMSRIERELELVRRHRGPSESERRADQLRREIEHAWVVYKARELSATNVYRLEHVRHAFVTAWTKARAS